MKPTIVEVHWSEAGHPLTQGRTLPFGEFEAAAQEAAMAHRTGGYLKTSITVHFDEGSTYGCRIDLAAYEPSERGFAHGIAQRIKHFESSNGQRQMADWPKSMREDWQQKYELWCQMDFTQDRTWCWWEVEDLSRPVDTTFCTFTTRH